MFAPTPPERTAAIAKGEKTYFTGVPCKRGHIAPRRVDSYACTECTRERSTAWAQTNPEATRAAHRKYHGSNRQKRTAARAEYYQLNRAKLLASSREWTKNNRERVRYFVRNRRARTAGKLSPDIESTLFKKQRGCCAVCRSALKATHTHLDHIAPLARGGPNIDGNVQLLCKRCNQRKHAKDPIQFMQEQGYLL